MYDIGRKVWISIPEIDQAGWIVERHWTTDLEGNRRASYFVQYGRGRDISYIICGSKDLKPYDCVCDVCDRILPDNKAFKYGYPLYSDGTTETVVMCFFCARGIPTKENRLDEIDRTFEQIEREHYNLA